MNTALIDNQTEGTPVVAVRRVVMRLDRKQADCLETHNRYDRWTLANNPGWLAADLRREPTIRRRLIKNEQRVLEAA